MCFFLAFPYPVLPSNIVTDRKFTDNYFKYEERKQHGPEKSTFYILCFLFPGLQSLLDADSFMCFWSIPEALATTQVKVDLKSSDVTFFNSKLLCRIAPSSKVDLKWSLQHSCKLSIIISALRSKKSEEVNLK